MTPPRTPRDSSDGSAAGCQIRSIPHKNRTKRTLHLRARWVDSIARRDLKARRGVLGARPLAGLRSYAEGAPGRAFGGALSRSS